MILIESSRDMTSRAAETDYLSNARYFEIKLAANLVMPFEAEAYELMKYQPTELRVQEASAQANQEN